MATKKKAAVTKAKAPTKAKTTATADAAGSDPFAALRDLLAQAKAAIGALALTKLTPGDRQHSSGKLRSGEAKAMTAVLDAVDLRPTVFASLAPRDHGDDDAVVETAPARDALSRVVDIEPLLATAEEVVQSLSDEILHQAALAKDVTVPAYAILKVNRAGDPKLAEAAKPAIDFYGRAARAKPKPSKNTPPAK